MTARAARRSAPARARSRKTPARVERVLVVYKKSAYQRLVVEQRSRRIKRLIGERDPSVDRLVEAHEAHIGTVERVREILERTGVRYEFRYLSARASADDADLVVTLGGDGTLLWASHAVGPETPMVAINTSPLDSVGYFCAGDRKNVREVLARALHLDLAPTSLTRMRVMLDGRVLSERVLNDALFSHECPAATTRYILEHRGVAEDQKSSGVWVGPAAGSTAAQRSAGGHVLPIGSKRLQFVVRELYDGRHESLELLKGLVEPDEALLVHSKTPSGKVYLDGPNRAHDVPIGSVLELRRSEQSLVLLGLKSRGR